MSNADTQLFLSMAQAHLRMAALAMDLNRPDTAVSVLEGVAGGAAGLKPQERANAQALLRQATAAAAVQHRKPPPDHYKLLGLSRTATEAEVGSGFQTRWSSNPVHCCSGSVMHGMLCPMPLQVRLWLVHSTDEFAWDVNIALVAGELAPCELGVFGALQIRKAYKSMALLYHPDKALAGVRFAARMGAGGLALAGAADIEQRVRDEAGWLFKCIAEAHAVLSDKKLRAEVQPLLRHLSNLPYCRKSFSEACSSPMFADWPALAGSGLIIRKVQVG